jgi:hypothetical protein
MRYKTKWLTGLLYMVAAASIHAQSNTSKLQEIQEIIRKEGDIFIAIDRINPGSQTSMPGRKFYSKQGPL